MSDASHARPMPDFDPDPEREPRRIIMIMIALIALLLLALLLWATFTELDVAVSGRGSITPPSRVQEVQSLEGGIVRELLVKPGQQVRQGDVLVRLDTVNMMPIWGPVRKTALQHWPDGRDSMPC